MLVTETYGGKVDDAADFEQLRSLVNTVLTADAFEENCNLIGAVAGDDSISVTLPSGTGKKDFADWVNGLPEREPPTYLGLPSSAEKLLLVAHAEEMIKNLRMIMDVLDEGEHVMAEATDTEL